MRSETGLEGAELWSKVHKNYSRTTLGMTLRVQRECMYPKATQEASQVRLAIMQGEGTAQERCVAFSWRKNDNDAKFPETVSEERSR